jgi:hypothetical protein
VESSAAVVLGCLGVFLLELARRARHGLVTPGSGLGWRTKATTRSEAAWFAGQRAAVPWNVVGGVVSLLGAGALALFGFVALSPVTLVMTVVGVGGIVAANRAANRAYDEVDKFG